MKTCWVQRVGWKASAVAAWCLLQSISLSALVIVAAMLMCPKSTNMQPS